MRKFMILALFALFLSQPSFAEDKMVPPDGPRSPDCEAIANACKDAGFSGYGFWRDCMKPVLFGKAVNGVTVDAKVVKDCRQAKIKDLQQQLNELKSVNTK